MQDITMWDSKVLVAYRLLNGSQKIQFYDTLIEKGVDRAMEFCDHIISDNINAMVQGDGDSDVIVATYDYVDERNNSWEVNVLFDGPIIYISSDRLVPIRHFLVPSVFEKGHILVRVPARKPKSVNKRYYRVYERLNPLQDVIPIYYN